MPQKGAHNKKKKNGKEESKRVTKRTRGEQFPWLSVWSAHLA